MRASSRLSLRNRRSSAERAVLLLAAAVLALACGRALAVVQLFETLTPEGAV